MDLTPYIPFGSALLGALVGGGISWFNLNRQFKEQRKRDILQERKNERIALNSVKKEVEFNISQLQVIQEDMEKYKLKTMDYNKESYLSLQLKREKWDKHSDTIQFIQDIDEELLIELDSFNHFIGLAIDTQKLRIENINPVLTMAQKILIKLEQILKETK